MADLIGSSAKELYLTKPDASESIFAAALGRSKGFQAFEQLLRERKLPREGWKEWEIEAFVGWLSSLDSNNFDGSIGVGEREGRIYSSIVRKRHFGFAHGIGRSGNLGESQPKAVGSTLLSLLASLLIKDALSHLGWQKQILAPGLALLPCCTGMSLTLALLALRRKFPGKGKVLWLRVDQKSCLKAITAAGLEVVVIEGKWLGDELVSDLDAVKAAIELHGPQNILAAVSCVSCFAPRAPDLVVAIGRLTQQHSIAHVINGAYAAFSPSARNAVNNAHFDLLVMSLDKNFLVPVSGAVIFGELTAAVLAGYPGRASAEGCLDAVITLLTAGVSGLKRLAEERKEAFELMKQKLGELPAEKARLLATPRNDVSMAIALPLQDSSRHQLGSKLFYRNVTGARLVTAGTEKVIDGVGLKNWCAHSWEARTECYLNVAVGVGSEPKEILEFFNKLIKLL